MPSGKSDNVSVWKVGTLVALAMLYMLIGGASMTFNKVLMRPAVFPYAMCLSLIEHLTGWICNSIFARLFPSLYPSLTDPELRQKLDLRFVLERLLVICLIQGVTGVLQNVTLMYNSLITVQVSSQSKLVLVYIMSLIFGLEMFSWRRLAALGIICFATAVSLHGDVNLSQIGVVIQSTLMMGEAVNLTLHSYMLNAPGKNIDPFSYSYLITPMVTTVIAVELGLINMYWQGRPEVLSIPPLELLHEFRWMLLLKGVMGFLYSLVYATFLKSVSPITYLVGGVLMKDTLVLTLGHYIFHEPVALEQLVGTGLQVMGLVVYALVKSDDKEKESAEAIKTVELTALQAQECGMDVKLLGEDEDDHKEASTGVSSSDSLLGDLFYDEGESIEMLEEGI